VTRALFIAWLLGSLAAWAQPYQLTVDSAPFVPVTGTKVALSTFRFEAAAAARTALSLS